MKKKTSDFLVDNSVGHEWLAVLIMPRTKENWMIAELDRYLDEVALDNSSTGIVLGRIYCYITIRAEIPEDLFPNEVSSVSNELRHACARARSSIKSIFGWCDYMSIIEFALHDRKMAERCFGIRTVRKVSRLRCQSRFGPARRAGSHLKRLGH